MELGNSTFWYEKLMKDNGLIRGYAGHSWVLIPLRPSKVLGTLEATLKVGKHTVPGFPIIHGDKGATKEYSFCTALGNKANGGGQRGPFLYPLLSFFLFI